MIILMSFNMQVFTREGEGYAVDHYVLQNIRVLATIGDSSLGKSGDAVERSQAIRVNGNLSRKCFVNGVDCQQNQVNGHQAKKFPAKRISC